MCWVIVLMRATGGSSSSAIILLKVFPWILVLSAPIHIEKEKNSQEVVASFGALSSDSNHQPKLAHCQCHLIQTQVGDGFPGLWLRGR